MVLCIMSKMLSEIVQIVKLIVLYYEDVRVRFCAKYRTGISIADVELGVNIVEDYDCKRVFVELYYPWKMR